MDFSVLGEYALKPLMQVWHRLKKHYTSEVDNGIDEAFQLALTDWSKHSPTSSDKVRLRKVAEDYIQGLMSCEALDPDTQVFIECFKRRLSEQPAAHSYSMRLRDDMQVKSEEQNLREHHKTQESLLDLMSQMEEHNMTPQYIRFLLKELPLEQGRERTELALAEMFTNGRIHSEDAKRLILEFVRFLFEHTDKISEEVKRLREAGDSYLVETLEDIKRVLTGESKQSLTAVYEKHKEQAWQNEIRVLKELVEAAQIQFSLREAREFYERLIDLAPTTEHHFNYAYLLQSLNDFDKARSHYEKALYALRELVETNPEAYKPFLAKTLNNLGSLLCYTNDFKQAQVYYMEALQIYLELAEKDPVAYQPSVATALNNLGNLFSNTNEDEQAQACYEKALQIYRELVEQNLEVYKPNVATTLNNLGNSLKNTNEYEQAQACYEEALQIRRDLLKYDPEAYKLNVAITLNNLGNLLRDIGELRQAQTCYEEALQILRELEQKIPEAYSPKVAIALSNLTLLYLKLEEEETAEKAYQEAHDVYQELACHHPRAYEINYAKILVLGFDFLGKPKEYIEEAKAILGKYPEHPEARKQLSIIEQLDER